MAASAYTSVWALTSRPSICSGAMYSIVPMNMPVPVSPLSAAELFAIPKSVR